MQTKKSIFFLFFLSKSSKIRIKSIIFFLSKSSKIRINMDLELIITFKDTFYFPFSEKKGVWQI